MPKDEGKCRQVCNPKTNKKEKWCVDGQGEVHKKVIGDC